MNITPTSLTVGQLLGAKNEQYVVPAYQRRFSWRKHQVRDLWDDLDALEGSDTHLLGTIVCLTGAHTAGVNTLELVDGQQRLTTISILLHCLLSRLRADGEEDEARDVEAMLQAKPPKGQAQLKIALDSLDAGQFAEHAAGDEPSFIENRLLADAFANVADWIRERSAEQILETVYKLTNQAIIIRLDVSDAKNAFKLFETINNRGLRLSSTDVIKNFMLGNAARFGAAELANAKQRWADLIRHLDGVGTETFFRQFLGAHLKTPVTKSMVVEEFQSIFMREVREAEQLPDRERYYDVDPDEDDEEEDETAADLRSASEADEPNETTKATVPAKVSFAEFLDGLVTRAKAYREVVLEKTGNAKLDRRLRNLRLIKAQPSYGFLMTLRHAGCSAKTFEQVLKLTEGFFLRRHTCRERTSDNERVFARLSGVDPKNPVNEVKKLFREYTPTDDKFREEFAATRYNAPLMSRARYCLEQFELKRQGDYVELLPAGPDSLEIEHIVPQKIKSKRMKKVYGDWPDYLGNGAEQRHPQYVGRIGNLTLFAGELNLGASNNPYARKKSAYKESAVKLTNCLPIEYPNFRFAQIDQRSKKLADVAVALWPTP